MKRTLAFAALFVLAFAVTLLVVGRPARRGAAPSQVELDAARDLLAQQRATVARAAAGEDVVLELDARDVRSLLLAAAAERTDRIMSQLRGLEVELGEDLLELRLVVASEALLEADLASSELGALGPMVEGARSLAGGDLPLVVRGSPVAVDGALGLALEDLEIRLGPLPLPLEELLSAEVKQELAENLQFAVPGLEIEEARAQPNLLVLRVKNARD
jgi:hypothetical protein